MSVDAIVHIATSLLLLAAGIGAWRGRREGNEESTGKTLKWLETEHKRDVERLEREMATLASVKDLDAFKAQYGTDHTRINGEIAGLRKRTHDLADAIQYDKVAIAYLRAKLGVQE